MRPMRDSPSRAICKLNKLIAFFTSRIFIFFCLIALQAWFFIWIAYGIDKQGYIQRAFWIGSVILALWVTTRHENNAYKIGWIMVILALPVFGMSMYIFFSQRPLGKRARAKEDMLHDASKKYLMQDPTTAAALERRSMDGYRQSRCIYEERHFPVYEHTRTKYFPMGQYFFESLVKDLETAESYIFMEYFIIDKGVMLDTILEILERKAKAGVTVRFMYDDLGTMNREPADFCERLKERGIEAQIFNPLRPILNSMFNNRDHRKITVIDGKIGYCSGANLADEYINVKKRFGTWKDEAIRLEGEAVWSLAMIFLSGWCFGLKEDEIDLSTLIPERPDCRNVPSDGFAQPFSDSPMDHTFLSRDVYLNMINRAKRYIYINTPYLDVGQDVMTALKNAAKSGVDVRMMVPHIPDKKIVFMLTRSYFPQLIRAGVKVYEYTPGFIHSKTFVSDDECGVIGTINMDFRSLYLHWECGVWVWGSSCIKELRDDYLETVKIATPISYAMTQGKNVFVRLFTSILQIFGPLL